MPVLLFDVDDTLVDRAGAFARLLDTWGRAWPEVATPSARAIIQGLDRRGAGDRRVFEEQVIARFPALAPAFREGFVPALIRQIEPRAAVIELVGALRRRYRAAVVTNGPRLSQTAKLRQAGLEVDILFEPADVGVEKPHPLIFRRALDWAGCPPSDCLFVGDDPECDIAGAARAGMRTAWLSEGRDYPLHLPPPDHVLPDLLALRRSVPC